MEQEEFIKSFLNIIKKLHGSSYNLDTVLEFCNIFKCSDIDIFRKFEKGVVKQEVDMDTVIDLYAEKFGIDKEKNLEGILYLFIQKAINGGVSYHLTNSASVYSIFQNGLGAETEENRDFQELKKLARTEEALGKLSPFGDDSKVICYSQIPNANVKRYGKMPEWIQEVRTNLSTVKEFKDEYDNITISDEMIEKAEEIVQKYNEKYYKMGRELLILPRLEPMFRSDDIEEMLKTKTPKRIMSFLYNTLRGNDLKYSGEKSLNKELTKAYISPSSIFGIDLDTLNVHFRGRDGQLKTISPYEKMEIQTPSCYSMKEVRIGNTGKMYQVDDEVDGGEYYFKPALTKGRKNAPYKAHIQEAAYRLQKIINPDNAVKCNTIYLEGMFGAIQEKILIDEQRTEAFKRYFNYGEGQLSPEIISQILNEYPVDFCLCNYDSAAKNFIIDSNGKLRGIDKEQSFRYLYKDANGDMEFSTNYNGFYGESPSIYYTLFEQMKQGKISCEYLNILREKASIIEQIPDEQYERYFRAYAARISENKEEKNELIGKIKDRRKGIKEKVEQLITEITQEAEKNKGIQTEDSQRWKITMETSVENAIQNGTTLTDVNRFANEMENQGEKSNEETYR